MPHPWATRWLPAGMPAVSFSLMHIFLCLSLPLTLALCEANGTQHSTALGFVCVKQPEENWPFPLFPYCPHQFMEVSQGVAPQNTHAQVRVGTCVGHHWPSSPAPGSTQHQKSNPMSESAVQSFLQLQQLCAHRPMGQNLYLTSPDPHLASPGTSPNKLRQVPCCLVRAVKMDFRGFAKWLIFTKI